MTYSDLLRTLTLGTVRQPPGPEVSQWVEAHDAADPTAETAEQLLAAFAVLERLQRFSPRTYGGGRLPEAPEETRTWPSPRMARALELVVEETYAGILPEVIGLLEDRGLLVPPHLLPPLLEYATGLLPQAPALALDCRRAGGQRADWLAAQHPEWRILSSSYDHPSAWAKALTPADRAAILLRWRQDDPAAAREALARDWPALSPTQQERLLETLFVNLGVADILWLRQSLQPKRKGVRRALFQLLLRAGEERALADGLTLAADALNEQGEFRRTLSLDAAKKTLGEYGGPRKGESLAEFLLSSLPPTAVSDLLGLEVREFWARLSKAHLAAAAQSVLAYDEPRVMAEFLEFAALVNPARLPLTVAAKISARLPQEPFLEVFHRLMEHEHHLFHFGGAPRILALARRTPWSERLTKAFVSQLLATLRQVQDLPYGRQKDLAAHWKAAIPLLHVYTFSWLGTHLNSFTERPDVFGKLATESLQTTHFRRLLREA